MVPVPVTAVQSLDGNDLALKAFGPAVGDAMATEGQDVLQMP